MKLNQHPSDVVEFTFKAMKVPPKDQGQIPNFDESVWGVKT